MPTELHDVHQRWVNNVICDWRAAGLITLQENRLICMGVGTSAFSLRLIFDKKSDLDGPNRSLTFVMTKTYGCKAVRQ